MVVPSFSRPSSSPMKTSPGRWKPSSAVIHGSEIRTTTAPTTTRRDPTVAAARRTARLAGRRRPSARARDDAERRNRVYPVRIEVVLSHEQGNRRAEAIAGPPAHHAARGSAAMARSTSAIATSAIGKLSRSAHG